MADCRTLSIQDSIPKLKYRIMYSVAAQSGKGSVRYKFEEKPT